MRMGDHMMRNMEGRSNCFEQNGIRPRDCFLGERVQVLPYKKLV